MKRTPHLCSKSFALVMVLMAISGSSLSNVSASASPLTVQAGQLPRAVFERRDQDRPSPASGPLYVEYQQPMRIHNRFIVGGLLAYLGLVAGWLLILGKRRTTGLVLGGLVVAVGLFLMVAGLH